MSRPPRRRPPRLRSPAAAAALALVAACPGGDDGEDTPDEAATEAEPADAGAEPEAPPADAAVASAEHDAPPPAIVLPPAAPVPPPPHGLPPTPAPDSNPTTAEKVALGKLLFFDPRLSADGAMSCADCHAPDKGFTDGVRRARTARGVTNARHTPSLENTAYAGTWFWDGSADTLEGAIASNWRGQMAADPYAVAADLNGEPVYRAHFLRAFDDLPTPEHIAAALAAYVRTIRSGDSPWDRYERGDEDAVDEAAVRGFRIFSGRAQCAVCHPPPLYTDRRFHQVGARAPDSPRDPGRYRATGERGDRGAMRTPSLRGLEHTAPYFHDGSAETLEDAVAIMIAGGRDGGGRDLEPVRLSGDELDDLVAFLRALSPDRKPYERPELPGE